MRRIILSALFGGTWLLILGVLYLASEWIAPIYEVTRERREIIARVGSRVEALSFGPSHASALDLSVLGLRGFYFHKSGVDLHEVSFLASEVVPITPAVRCIFIALSPGIVHADNGAPTAVDLRGARRELYARTLSFRHIAGDRTAWAAGKAAPLVRDDHWGGVAAVLLGRARADVDSTGRARGEAPEQFSDAQLASYGPIRARQHDQRSAAVLAERPWAADSASAALDRVARLAAERSVTVVLYTPPYHAAYLRAMPPGALSTTRYLGAAMAREHPHVRYLDLSTHRDLAGAGSGIFRNPDHLNAEGTRIASTRIAAALREEGLCTH